MYVLTNYLLKLDKRDIKKTLNKTVINNMPLQAYALHASAQERVKTRYYITAMIINNVN